jgi:hypothetical protein
MGGRCVCMLGSPAYAVVVVAQAACLGCRRRGVCWLALAIREADRGFGFSKNFENYMRSWAIRRGVLVHPYTPTIIRPPPQCAIAIELQLQTDCKSNRFAN